MGERRFDLVVGLRADPGTHSRRSSTSVVTGAIITAAMRGELTGELLVELGGWFTRSAAIAGAASSRWAPVRCS